MPKWALLLASMSCAIHLSAGKYLVSDFADRTPWRRVTGTDILIQRMGVGGQLQGPGSSQIAFFP